MVTARDIVQSALTRLRLFGGIDVQTYAQPVIFEMLQHKFDVIFDKANWPHYTTYTECVLDPATGSPITDMSAIKRYHDIRKIWLPQYSTALSPLRENVNPYSVQHPVIVPDTDPAKVFRILRSEQWNECLVYAKQHPGTLDEDTIIYLDKQVLILGICYDYVLDQDVSRINGDKFLKMYNDRLNTILGEFTAGERSLRTEEIGIPNKWM